MKKTQTLTLSALFLSIMLVLSYIESVLGIGGTNGIKLGLSNSVLLISLYWLGIPISLTLMVSKVLLTGLVLGTIGSTVTWFSLAGGVLSMAGMILAIYKLHGISPIAAGILGGALHNIGQIIVLLLLTRINIMLFFAILIIIGGVMGAITGTVANTLMQFLPYERRAALGIVRKQTSAEKQLNAQEKKA